jgi:hypothetical protein
MNTAKSERKNFQDRLMEMPEEQRPRACLIHAIKGELERQPYQVLEFVYYYMIADPKKTFKSNKAMEA